MAKSDERIDPRPRPTEARVWSTLRDKDPERFYTWVSLADAHQGIDYYVDIGYRVEQFRPGGVRPIGTQKPEDKDRLVRFGHALMSVALAEKARIEREGIDGESGQAAADVIEDQIIDRKRGVDLLRGIGITGREGIFHRAGKGHNVHIPDGE